ncbi:hypothetical protein [Mycobacterium cookii]|uniref:hypothetical protein n=1 Tax=Mycobacterium cookii TaxID=1775 RepID=UPI001E2FAB9E|nr:hypothetical protein [Mycobacterium cookii]
MYFAVSLEGVVGVPHSSQNLAFSLKPVPQDPHTTLTVNQAPPISNPTPRTLQG